MNNNYIYLNNVSKIYNNDFNALDNINLKIRKGEIFALLGPNGAGKTTLINIICGLTTCSNGEIIINNLDHKKNFKKIKSIIGLVPQELTLEAFETVFKTVSYTRGLYGKAKNPLYIEKTLKKLSIWDKKNELLNNLSGGMKRRVLIAKALSHKPKILFLDEPSAGVDVELRKEMWKTINELKNEGVTIILTTHYIEEAEEIADRVGVINKGKLIIVEDKVKLIKKMGQKKLVIDLDSKLKTIPKKLSKFNLKINAKRDQITFIYSKGKNKEIISLLYELRQLGINVKDLKTSQRSLESIFVNLVKSSNNELASN